LLQSEALGLVWRLKQSQLYALLGRLEEAGYIENTIESQPARPARKIMRLTSSGREAFKRWVASPVEHGRDFRIEFLAKLFFARQEDTAASNALIDPVPRQCQALAVEVHPQAQA